MAESAKVVFHALDRNAEIDISHRNLPHWFQVGAAMFITFRSAEQFVYLQNYTAGNPARANLRINEFVLWERQ